MYWSNCDSILSVSVKKTYHSRCAAVPRKIFTWHLSSLYGRKLNLHMRRRHIGQSFFSLLNILIVRPKRHEHWLSFFQSFYWLIHSRWSLFNKKPLPKVEIQLKWLFSWPNRVMKTIYFHASFKAKTQFIASNLKCICVFGSTITSEVIHGDSIWLCASNTLVLWLLQPCCLHVDVSGYSVASLLFPMILLPLFLFLFVRWLTQCFCKAFTSWSVARISPWGPKFLC